MISQTAPVDAGLISQTAPIAWVSSTNMTLKWCLVRNPKPIDSVSLHPTPKIAHQYRWLTARKIGSDKRRRPSIPSFPVMKGAICRVVNRIRFIRYIASFTSKHQIHFTVVFRLGEIRFILDDCKLLFSSVPYRFSCVVKRWINFNW